MVKTTNTYRPREYWDRKANGYDRMMNRVGRLLFGDARAWACRQASGRTLEVAIGTGLNLPLYDADIELTGIDISPEMLAIARRRASELGRQADLREADAQRLPFDDEAFDTVLSTLSMCAVPDLDAALSEMYRVLRPGGRLVLVDHVRPTARVLLWWLTAMQWAVNRFAPANGEQFLRRPYDNVLTRGFAVETSERFKGGAIERLVATKPA